METRIFGILGTVEEMGKIEKIGFENQEKWDCRYLDSGFVLMMMWFDG